MIRIFISFHNKINEFQLKLFCETKISFIYSTKFLNHCSRLLFMAGRKVNRKSENFARKRGYRCQDCRNCSKKQSPRLYSYPVYIFRLSILTIKFSKKFQRHPQLRNLWLPRPSAVNYLQRGCLAAFKLRINGQNCHQCTVAHRQTMALFWFNGYDIYIYATCDSFRSINHEMHVLAIIKSDSKSVHHTVWHSTVRTVYQCDLLENSVPFVSIQHDHNQISHIKILLRRMCVHFFDLQNQMSQQSGDSFCLKISPYHLLNEAVTNRNYILFVYSQLSLGVGKWMISGWKTKRKKKKSGNFFN